MKPDDITLNEYSLALERLKKEVEYWKTQYYKVKDENERLALDLGLKEHGYLDERKN
jgi:hypothetical protein